MLHGGAGTSAGQGGWHKHSVADMDGHACHSCDLQFMLYGTRRRSVPVAA